MRQNHRRIKRDRLQTIYFRNRTVTKDNEGVPIESFETAFERSAEVWPAGGRRQIEQYGDRIANIANARVQGKYTLGDHFCIFLTTATLLRWVTEYVFLSAAMNCPITG